MLFWSVAVPYVLHPFLGLHICTPFRIAPPSTALFPLRVPLLILNVPVFKMPPPCQVGALFPLIVLLLIVSVAVPATPLTMPPPPPADALLPLMALLLIIIVAPSL